MANLRDIRNRIGSVNNTQQITKAMKMVAAAKLRKAQDRMVQTRPYALKIQNVVGRLALGSEINNPLLRTSDEVNNILIIVVGSDRGLCGGFNNNLFKEIEKSIDKNFVAQRANDTLSLITIGKKATVHFSKRKYNVVAKYPGFFDQLEYDASSAIMNNTIEEFINGSFDEVYIAYNEFKSVIAQNRIIDKILPIDPKTVSGNESVESIDYIFEPSSTEILDQLLPLHLNVQFHYKYFAK